MEGEFYECLLQTGGDQGDKSIHSLVKLWQPSDESENQIFSLTFLAS